MQIVGAFLLQMVMGSILNWSILNQKLNTFLSTSYLVIILNIAMLFRLLINKYMYRQRKLGLQIIALFIYMLSLFMMEIIPEKFLFIFPIIYVFFIGLIILDPLDQLLIENPLSFEKYICLFFCSLFIGWIGFGLIQSIIIKEECQKRCYFIYPALISIITIIGFYLFYPRYSTLDEEFDSRTNFQDDPINRDIIHNTFIIQEKNILKDENFYLVMYKFAMLFTPAIGSMDYIIQKNDNLFLAWLVMGLATIFGSLITMLLKQPYKFNTIIVIAQLGMMIAINLLGVVHQNYQLIVLALQFLLFGFICCFNVLILQNTYDNVIENIPIAFIALSITTMAQYLLFYFLDNKKLIQSIEFTLIVISYLSNWLII